MRSSSPIVVLDRDRFYLNELWVMEEKYLASNKDVHFLKYLIYVGRNRGRGHIYPDGIKSNNKVYNATTIGIISKIIRKEKEVRNNHNRCNGWTSSGPELLISEGESIKLDQPLTINPNVGGFGQGMRNSTSRSITRPRPFVLFAYIVFARIFFILKKKQFEKVQVSEMNF
ncbi:hypothetical protein GQ457_12G009530 [Hibiscus cannabinus]